ncbi:hypothetical protein HY993_04585 [Candidatus Micrarchaeota archaeon]|nr:hypothetical protein [Candidatus Micrarchaeota archaeon]
MKFFSTIVFAALLFGLLAVGVGADEVNSTDAAATDGTAIAASATPAIGGLDKAVGSRGLADKLREGIAKNPDLGKKLGGIKDSKPALANAAKALAVASRAAVKEKREAFAQAKEKLERQKKQVRKLAVKAYAKMDGSEKQVYKQAVFAVVENHFGKILAALEKQIAQGDLDAVEVREFIETKKTEFSAASNVTEKRAVVAQVNAKWLEYQKKAREGQLSLKIANATAKATQILERIKLASSALASKGFNTTRLDAQIALAQKAIAGVGEQGISLKQARWRLARVNAIFAHLKVALIRTINKQDVQVPSEEAEPEFEETEGITQAEAPSEADSATAQPSAQATAIEQAQATAEASSTPSVEANASQAAAAATVEATASATTAADASVSATADANATAIVNSS